MTPTLRCKGLYLNVLGDLTIAGTLSMTAKGANAEGRYVGIDMKRKIVYFTVRDEFTGLRDFTIIQPRGGSANSAGKNGACGGGGTGNGINGKAGGAGSYGTSFCGGSGGSGSGVFQNGNAAAINGGPGGATFIFNDGNSGNKRAGGGASDGGGLLIIFVKGNVNITGSIQAGGTKGQAGGSAAGGTSNGGGSGGGAIHIFHSGDIVGGNKITAVGGTVRGGAGTIKIVKQ